jgi:hypothetical protein
MIGGARRDELTTHCRRFGVRRLEQFFGFAQALERALGRPVDLVERGAVANPFILAGIETARELVYAD